MNCCKLMDVRSLSFVHPLIFHSVSIGSIPQSHSYADYFEYQKLCQSENAKLIVAECL